MIYTMQLLYSSFLNILKTLSLFNIKKMKKKIKIIYLIIIVFLINVSCSNIFRKVDTRQTPINAQERARKNVEEGRGIAIGKVLGRGNTTYEFSTSNPLWRASIEILDFLPLTTVDYSGGIIITDWYSDSNSLANESLKITVRFLSNEIQTNSIKIIIHQKICLKDNCSIKEINSKIKEELTKTILTNATLLATEDKKK